MPSGIRGVLPALLLAGMILPAVGQSQDRPDVEPLIGTWQVKVNLVNCQTGAAMGPPFSSILTFALGGTLAEDTTNPAFDHGQRSSGQGVWHEAGHDVFKVRSVAFINYQTSPGDPIPTSPGFEAGQQSITQVITYNHHTDQWTAVASITFTDTNGNAYREGCATAMATRF